MTLSDTLIQELGGEFYTALKNRQVVDPLTSRYPEITVDEAYAISMAFLNLRLDAGEKVIGRKIGITSEAVQKQLGVGQPDFGALTDAMCFSAGATVPISELLIQPKLEGEIAFVMGEDLQGTSFTEDDILQSAEYVVPCFEIVDSRVRDWKISIQDTVADNASCGLYVLGDQRTDPKSIDLAACEMKIETDGQLVATGLGSAALGSPVKAVVWLANAMARYGTMLRKGDVILSGSLGPLLDCQVGTETRVVISGLGEVSVRFS